MRTTDHRKRFIVRANEKLTAFMNCKGRFFKENIKPMAKASELLLAFSPVTFRYKKEIDPDGKSQFGLMAEDVER